MIFKNAPPDRFRTHPHEVHLWLLPITGALSLLPGLERLLSGGERERARLFARPTPARRFIIARGFLRLLLGKYSGLPPGRIVLDFGENGKPRLADAASDIAFNLSHSGAFVLAAVGAGRRLGVDIEEVQAGRDLAAPAAYVFPAGTAARLAALPAAERAARFFQLWTRWESTAKATGLGLGALPDLRAVDLEGDSPFVLAAAGAEWTVLDIPLPSGPGRPGTYRAALCGAGRILSAAGFTADTARIAEWLREI